MPSVLIIDDEPNIRRMVGALLSAEGYEVRDAQDGASGLARVTEAEPDVLLLDLMMPGELDGLATLARVRESNPDVPVIMMSGRAGLSDAVKATKLGAFNFLEKPLSPEGVVLALASALGSAEVLANIYDEYARVAEMKGDLRTALDFQRKLAEATETMRGENDRQRIAELRARFDAEQRELEIRLLRRDQDVQTAELRRRRSQNIALAAGLVLGVVLFGAVIVVQRVRLHAERRLLAATEHARERFLHPDEFPRFWKALEDHPDEKLRDFFKVSLLTGARRSNVQAMRWAHVNLERATWTMPPEEMKGDRAMVITLAAPVVAILTERKAANDRKNPGERSPYVFPSYGRTGHLTEPKAAWAAILERAGLDGFQQGACRNA